MYAKYGNSVESRRYAARMFTCGLLFFGVFFCGIRHTQAVDTKLMGIREIFLQMEKAMESGDEDAFRSLWYMDGYNANPTGRKGYSGKMAFDQGSRDGWYIKPDFKAILKDGLTEVIKSHDVVIIPSHIWSMKKHEAIRDVHIALVRDGQQWLVLGVSESVADLERMVNHLKNPW